MGQFGMGQSVRRVEDHLVVVDVSLGIGDERAGDEGGGVGRTHHAVARSGVAVDAQDASAGAGIEQFRGEAAKRLSEAGGLGAFLRY